MQAIVTLRRRKPAGLAGLALLALSVCVVSPAQAQILAPAGGYFRAEAGAVFHQNVTFVDTNPGAANCDLCGAQFPSSIGDSFLIGAALGYRIAPGFRADVSVDYFGSAQVSGHSTAAVPSTGTAHMDSIVGLLNGYVDLPGLPVFGPFRPYLDAGLGVARNELGNTTGNSGAVGPFTLAGSSRTNFAWAIGAGAGYTLTPNLTLDIAYRYLSLGQLRTDTSLAFAGISVQVTPSKTDSVNIHALTVGLRYEF